MKQRGNFVVAFMIGNRNYGRRQTFYLLGGGGGVGWLANTVPGIRWGCDARDGFMRTISTIPAGIWWAVRQNIDSNDSNKLQGRISRMLPSTVFFGFFLLHNLHMYLLVGQERGYLYTVPYLR
jgi:hypothetical protein